jgi:hypothetical protein
VLFGALLINPSGPKGNNEEERSDACHNHIRFSPLPTCDFALLLLCG